MRRKTFTFVYLIIIFLFLVNNLGSNDNRCNNAFRCFTGGGNDKLLKFPDTVFIVIDPGHGEIQSLQAEQPSSRAAFQSFAFKGSKELRG